MANPKGPASDGTSAAEPSQSEPKPQTKPQKIGGLPPNIANQFQPKGAKHGSQMKNTARNFRHQGR